jgi:hypothetical protein
MFYRNSVIGEVHYADEGVILPVNLREKRCV